MTTIPGTIYTLYTREFSLLPHADLLQAFRPVALIGFFGGRSHRRPEDIHTLAVGCSLWRRRAKSDPDAVPWPSHSMAMFDETGKRSQDRRAYVHHECRPTATSGCYQEVIRTSPLTSSGGQQHATPAEPDAMNQGHPELAQPAPAVDGEAVQESNRSRSPRACSSHPRSDSE